MGERAGCELLPADDGTADGTEHQSSADIIATVCKGNIALASCEQLITSLPARLQGVARCSSRDNDAHERRRRSLAMASFVA